MLNTQKHLENRRKMIIFEVGKARNTARSFSSYMFTRENKKTCDFHKPHVPLKENKSNHHEYYFSVAITFAELNESFALLNRSNAFSH